MLKISKNYRIENNIIKKDSETIYIYDSLLEINGRQIISSGIDTDEDLAFKKMISETCERFCMFKNSLKNSTGMASHYNLELCIENSKIEIYERNFLKKLSLDNSILPDTTKYENNDEYHIFNINDKYYFTLYKLRETLSYSYGIGTSNNKALSLKKAYFESLLMNDSFIKYNIKGSAFRINNSILDPDDIEVIDTVLFLNEYRYVTGIQNAK